EHERAELDDVDALHRGDGAEPSRGAAGAEPDHQRAFWLRMPQRAEQAEHYLRAGIGACAAVGFAGDDDRIAARLRGERDTAFDAVAVPDDRAPMRVFPRAQLVRRGQDIARRTPGADAGVTPDSSRPFGEEEQRAGDDHEG